MFDELAEGLEAILAAGHMGVIVQLTDSCAEREEKQGEMMQRLLNAFHCAEPASRHTACLPLFLSLLTHEVYYSSEAAEGNTQTEVLVSKSPNERDVLNTPTHPTLDLTPSILCLSIKRPTLSSFVFPLPSLAPPILYLLPWLASGPVPGQVQRPLPAPEQPTLSDPR